MCREDQDVKIIACPIFSVETERKNNKLSWAFAITWQNINDGQNLLKGKTSPQGGKCGIITRHTRRKKVKNRSHSFSESLSSKASCGANYMAQSAHFTWQFYIL